MTAYPLFDPTSLFAGVTPSIKHRNVTYASGAAIVLRGTVLGRTGTGGSAVGSASGTNTGGSTIGTVSITSGGGAVAGIYNIVYLTATTFKVLDPYGDLIGTGLNGTPFTTQVTFTMTTAGAANVAGDQYFVTVSGARDTYIPAIASASDGSQIPVAIAATDVDVTGGNKVGPAYFAGEFGGEVLIMDASMSIAGVEALFRENNIPIYVKKLGTLG